MLMTIGAVEAVTQAVNALCSTQVDTSAFPGLADDIEKVHQHSRSWMEIQRQEVGPLRRTKDMVDYFLESTGPDLQDLAKRFQLERSELDLSIYDRELSQATTAFKNARISQELRRQAVSDLQSDLAADSQSLAAELEKIQESLTQDQQLSKELGEQVRSLREKISHVHKCELIGLLGGPIGYGIARIWGDNLADVDGIERHISNLEQQDDTTDKTEVALVSLTARVGSLMHLISIAVAAMTGLVNGLDAVISQSENVLTSIADTQVSDGIFLEADIETITRDCVDLSKELDVLLTGHTNR
ncbi:hypothetical protein ABZ611_27505 [Streptomyces sp. NPDC007861]|uniref:hypothetical protein n=1 Tax=Streptomyces sp. NPDC007861 TaxID=3154893 RepID=UPI0033F76834